MPKPASFLAWQKSKYLACIWSSLALPSAIAVRMAEWSRALDFCFYPGLQQWEPRGPEFESHYCQIIIYVFFLLKFVDFGKNNLIKINNDKKDLISNPTVINLHPLKILTNKLKFCYLAVGTQRTWVRIPLLPNYYLCFFFFNWNLLIFF